MKRIPHVADRRLFAAMLCIVLVAGCSNKSGGSGGFFGAKPQGTQPSALSKPTGTGTQATSVAQNPGSGAGSAGTALPPDQMLQALARSEIGDSEVPQGFLYGFKALDAKSQSPDAEMGKFKAVGQVRVNTRRAFEEYNPLLFVVLPTEADATAYQQQAKVPHLNQSGTFAARGIAEPVRCVKGTVLDESGKAVGGGSACLARAGLVVVIGQSQGAVNDKNAIAVTMLGLNHLPLAVAAFTARAPATAAAATPAGGQPATPVATGTTRPSGAGGAASTVAATQPPANATLPVPPGSALPTAGGAAATAVRPPARPPSTPGDLYTALLATPFTPGELPQGFAVYRISAEDPGSGSRAFNAVGRVAVDLDGSDSSDGIAYVVYASEADAKGRFDRAAPGSQTTQAATFTPPGFSFPAKCLTGSVPDAAARVGTTVCIVLVGTVEVWGTTILSANPVRGNDDNAIALARAGIAHLQRVQSGR